MAQNFPKKVPKVPPKYLNLHENARNKLISFTPSETVSCNISCFTVFLLSGHAQRFFLVASSNFRNQTFSYKNTSKLRQILQEKNREKNVPAKTYKNLNIWPHIIIPSLELCPSWYFSSVSYSLVLSLFSKTKALAERERLQTEHSQSLNFPQTSWFTPLCKLVSRNRYFVKSCGCRYRQYARCASRRFKDN